MQGEPRATHDIDFIVTVTADSIEIFLRNFSPDDYYYDIDAAKKAMGTWKYGFGG
jgi:hypothetical protein